MDEKKVENNQAACKVCGQLLEPSLVLAEENTEKLCFKCLAVRAAESIPPTPQVTLKQWKSRHKKNIMIAECLVLTACIIAFFMYFPSIHHTLKTASKPARYGSYETDTLTDKCIENLWYAVKLLQTGKEIPPDLICPVSGQRYYVKKAKGDVFISCPTPEKHGFDGIVATRSHPMPKLLKNH